MIRICKSPTRKPEEYAILATILVKGLESICVNNCDLCPWKSVCNSIEKAADYAVKLAETVRM